MSNDHQSSLGLQILVKSLLNIGLTWVMATYLSTYFVLTGGWPAIIIVGMVLMAMNVIVRPILNILTLPLRLFATILAIIIVNGLFLYGTTEFLSLFVDASIMTLAIGGGVGGWVVLSLVTGLGNWAIKAVMK